MSKIVVITGSSSGIGDALARQYLNAGAKVVGLDVNSAHNVSAFYKVDVSNEDQMNTVAQRIVEEVGRPTHWYNNAGIAVLGAFEKISSKEFDRVLDVNLKGVVYGTRAAIKAMNGMGVIINVASVAGIVPCSYMSSYVATKHAVVGFTRALRLEHEQAKSQMRFVLVSPGMVKTPIMEPNGEKWLPSKFDFMVEDPAKVAREIISGVERGKVEIKPTRSGKMLLASYRISPTLATKSSRMLVSTNWKQLLGLEKIHR
ncbi:MAG: SDR family NAD(P)-dependent oxidoreductase [Bacteriovoracia bacterium]